MSASSRPEPITQLLSAVHTGTPGAAERLWALVYDELRKVAHRQLRAEKPNHALQTTILVHEAYLRLVGHDDIRWNSRRHFFAAAAKAMRRIRIDDARKRGCLKRGGPGLADANGAGAAGGTGGTDAAGAAGAPAGWPTPTAPCRGPSAHTVPLGDGHAAPTHDPDPAELLALDEALTKLEELDPAKAEIVMLRYFAGLTIDETAAALDLAPRTVDKEWSFARAWLHRFLTGQ